MEYHPVRFAQFLLSTKKRYIAMHVPTVYRVRCVPESCALVLAMEKTELLPREVVDMILAHLFDLCYECYVCEKMVPVSPYVISTTGNVFCSDECRLSLGVLRRSTSRMDDVD